MSDHADSLSTQQQFLDQLLERLHAHSPQQHNAKMADNLIAIILSEEFLSGSDLLCRRQQFIESNMLDSIFYLPTTPRDSQPQRQCICLLRPASDHDSAHRSVLFIDLFHSATEQDLADQAEVKFQADVYHQAWLEEILSIYRQVRYPIQPDIELNSSVCYASAFNDLQAGMLLNGKAYLATRAEIMSRQFNLDFSAEMHQAKKAYDQGLVDDCS